APTSAGTARSAPRTLPLEQRPLALDAPAIAGQIAVAAHDAMAGDRNRDPVRRACLAHRSHRARRTDPLGELRIAERLPGRDRAQRLPDALLEGRAAQVERQVESDLGRLDESDHARDSTLERTIP